MFLGTELAPARFAGTVVGQQANFALKARAWYSLETGGELLAAKKMYYEERRYAVPASATKLLAAKRSQPPAATIFAASSPCFDISGPVKVVIYVL